MHDQSAYVIFCDDLRIEQSNKRTFVGVYGTEMYIDAIPSILPRLCVISTLICSLLKLPKIFNVRLVMAGETIQEFSVPQSQLEQWRIGIEKDLSAEVEEFKDEEPPKTRISVEQILSPFSVSVEGRLSAYIETDHGTVRAGSISIYRGTGPRERNAQS